MTTKEITYEAAKELSLPPKLVWEVYKGYWAAIRHFLSSLPLKEDITKEEFDKLKTSVNIPSLGKFYADWDSIQSKKEKYEIFKNKKTETAVHNSIDNT